MKKLLVGGFGLGLALCLPVWGAVYTGGDCSANNLLHRWSFNGDLSDSVGGITATAVGNATLVNGQVSLPGVGKGGVDYVNLGAHTLPTSGACTIEIFATQKGVRNWGRIFSVGKDPASGVDPNTIDLFFMGWTLQSNINNDQWKLACSGTAPTAAFYVDGSLQPYTLNTEWHISAVFEPQGDGTMKITCTKESRDGTIRRIGTKTTTVAWSLAALDPDSFYLGRSRWSGDNDAQADYNEVRVWNAALTPEQLAWSARLGADTLPTAAAASAETATVTATAEAGGKVAIDGGAAALTGNTTVAKNQLVTLTATADANYHFTGWTGDVAVIQNGTATDATITVYAAYAASLTATFRQNTATWTGAGTDNLWSTAANWQDSLLPVDHAQLVFNGTTRITNQNDVVTALDKITFGADAAEHKLTGQGITLAGPIENLSAKPQTIAFPVTAPTLDITGSGTTIFDAQVTSTVHNFGTGSKVYFNGGVSSPDAYEVIYGGDVYVQGTSQVKSLCLNSDGTVWNFPDADSVFNASVDIVANNQLAAGKSATINIGGGTIKVGQDLRTDWQPSGNNGTGIINQTGGDVTVTKIITIGRNGTGTYNLTGGTLTQTASSGDWLRVGEYAGANGTLNVGGTAKLSTAWNAFFGANGTGTVNVNGGELDVTAALVVGRYSSGVGTFNVTDGLVKQTRGDGLFIVGEEGQGTVNISGKGVVDVAGAVSFAHRTSAAKGILNLTDGGTLRTPRIQMPNTQSSSKMYVNGGTLVAQGSGAVLGNFCTMPFVDIGPKGMTFDTGDNTVCIDQPLGSGSSEGTITKVGSGTLRLPAASAPVKVQAGTVAVGHESIGDWQGQSGVTETPPHLLHRWSFNGDFTDSVGGLDATGVGTSFVDNMVRLPGGNNGTSYVNLNPAALPKDRAFTIEIFATPRATRNWGRVLGFGKGVPNADHKENFFMSWCRNSNASQDQIRLRYNNGQDAFTINDTLQPYTLNTAWHIVLTYEPNVTADGKGRFFWSKTSLDGANHREYSVITSCPVNLATWGIDQFYLGRSFWAGDLDCQADFDEVRIWDAAFSSQQALTNAKLGPNALPQPAAAVAETALVHRWSFNGDAKDSVGGTTASLQGGAVQGAEGVSTKGSGYINLGNNMLPTDGSPVTIEIWATQHSIRKWGRVFDIGPNNQNYLTLAWNYEAKNNKDRLEIKKNNAPLITSDDKLVGYVMGTENHISITIVPRADGKVDLRWMRRDARTGVLLKEGSGTTSAAWSTADIAGGPFYLGHSQYAPGDLDADATYNEVRVWKAKLTDTQLSRSVRLGPNALPTAEADVFAKVDVAAGTTFKTESGVNAKAAVVTGTGTLDGAGTLTVVKTLDIAGEDVGTMTLNGSLAVTGTWMLDMDASSCDLLTGTGTLDLSQATIDVRDFAQLRGGALLATVGEVTGYQQAKVNVRGYVLRCKEGRLTLVTDGLAIIFR